MSITARYDKENKFISIIRFVNLYIETRIQLNKYRLLIIVY